jgi:hypothetical protein
MEKHEPWVTMIHGSCLIFAHKARRIKKPWASSVPTVNRQKIPAMGALGQGENLTAVDKCHANH